MNSEEGIVNISNEENVEQINSETKEDQIINEDSKKWTATRFNSQQINIIDYVLKNGQLSIPYMKFNEKEHEDRHKESYIFGFNELSSTFHRIYSHDNYIVSNKTFYYDFWQMVYNLISNGLILYINNVSRAELRGIIDTNQKIKTDEKTSNIIELTAAEYILMKIRNPPITIFPKNKEDIEKFNSFIEFAPFVAHALTHGIFERYIKFNDGVEYNNRFNYEIKPKIKIVQVPHDLQNKFNKIYKHFNELKSMLSYDEENGFYVYKQDGVSLPIICIHEYMILNGCSLSEVSIKCYLDGTCKYCGAEMNAYHQSAKQELPVKCYDLIYKFMDCLNENVDQSLMMIGIFDVLYNSVKKNVDSANPNNYDESVVAFSALYLYAMYMITKHAINYSPTKINKFIDSAKKYWSSIGWNQRSIDQTLESSMFDELQDNNNGVNLLKQFIFHNEISFLDILPLSVMFDTVVNPKEKDKLKADTMIRKLYLDNKMNDFNKKIFNMIMKTWTVITTKPIIEKYPKQDFKSIINNIKTKKLNSGQRFFNECCKKWCPINIDHEWKNGQCIHCHIKQDLSNQKEIYNNNVNVINNSYLQEPNVISDEKLILGPVHSMVEISKCKAEELYDKHLTIDAYVLKQAIDKKLVELSDWDELNALIVALIGCKAEEVKHDTQFIKQCLVYIIINGIATKEHMLNELQNIFFKIENIDWLTL